MAAILGTNVVLRHLLQDHAIHSPRATSFFHRLEAAELRVILPITVLFEAAYILQKSFGQTRVQVRSDLEGLIDLPGVSIPDRTMARRAFEIYGQHNVSFADAYHAALAEREDPPQLITFDRGLSRVRTIERVEP